MTRRQRHLAPAAVVIVLLAACSSSDARGASTTDDRSPTTPSTTAPTRTQALTPPLPAAPASEPPDPADPIALLEALASDDLLGRGNMTSSSETAQRMLITRLAQFAEPFDPAGGDIEGYRQRFAEGTNIIGIIPGTDLADEYVVVGAHYDHLGGDCRLANPDDGICNGAVDNASGTAATMAIGAAIAAEAPRRSVIIAFWDAEEDGLVGSLAFVDDPVVPLGGIVASVTFDMQGSRLLPSLADHTFAIGAETGGQTLVDLVAEVTDASPLDYASLSLITGQGRSDHAPLAAAGVPVVFFTDATNGCYHTVDDEMAVVDLAKLDAQIAVATEVVRRLAAGAPVEFAPGTPATTFSDAEELLVLARAGEPDFSLVQPPGAAQSTLDAIQAVVDGGAAAYDGAAEESLLGAAALLMQLLSQVDCALVTPG